MHIGGSATAVAAFVASRASGAAGAKRGEQRRNVERYEPPAEVEVAE